MREYDSHLASFLLVRVEIIIELPPPVWGVIHDWLKTLPGLVCDKVFTLFIFWSDIIMSLTPISLYFSPFSADASSRFFFFKLRVSVANFLAICLYQIQSFDSDAQKIGNNKLC